VRFPARELKDHCDYVRAKDLVVGEVYFRVHFLDDEGLVPELLPCVFVGRNLLSSDEGGTSFLYFRAIDPSSPPPYRAVAGDFDRGEKHEEDPAEGSSLECEEENEYRGVVCSRRRWTSCLSVPCAGTPGGHVSERLAADGAVRRH